MPPVKHNLRELFNLLCAMPRQLDIKKYLTLPGLVF